MSQGETKGKIKNFPPKAYRQSVFSCQSPKFIFKYGEGSTTRRLCLPFKRG